MSITILLDPEAEEYGVLQRDLRTELDALQTEKLRVRTRTAPPPPGTLALEEVFQFVVEHGEEIRSVAIPAVLEVIKAVLRRWSEGKKKSKETPVLVIVDGRTLKYPWSHDAERRVLSVPSTQQGSEPRASSKPAPKKPKRKRR
jgi:hypothetical protein